LVSNIQTAMNALSNVGSGNCTVTGSGGEITLTFDGALSSAVISQCGVDYGGDGTVTPALGNPCLITFGGMTSGDTFTLTIGVGAPFFNMSGYRYLKFSNCLTSNGSAQTRTLTINGKTWPIVFPTTTPESITVDLCYPATGGASYDTTDSILAPGDPNPTLSPAGGGTDGPLWGVTYVESISISGFVAGSVESFSSVDLVLGSETLGQFITTWEPRFTAMPQYGPPWPVGTDFTAYRAENRSAILITDGRQSMEWDGQSVLDIDGSPSPFSATAYSITRTVVKINAGYILDGGQVGIATAESPYYAYATVPNGWVATQVIPANDCSDYVDNGYMNGNLPASWLWGDGAIYTGTLEDQGFTTGIGVSPSSVPVQMLCSSIDFYPGCGDVFGFAGTPGAGHTIYIGASKVYRAQAWGILIDPDTGAPSSETAVKLYAGAGGIQPEGMLVGATVSDETEAVYRTTGVSLSGIDVISLGPIGEGGATLYDTTGSTGYVEVVNDDGEVTVVEQVFLEQKLSRVAIVAPPGTTPTQEAGACLQRSPDMGGPWS
jgi:hypothetical protein